MDKDRKPVLEVQPATPERWEYVDTVFAQMLAKRRQESKLPESPDEDDSYDIGTLYRQVVCKSD